MTRRLWLEALWKSLRLTIESLIPGCAVFALLAFATQTPVRDAFLDAMPTMLFLLAPFFGIVLALNVARLKGDIE